MARPNIKVTHLSVAVCECGWRFESESRNDTWHEVTTHFLEGCDAPLVCLDCGESKEMYPQWLQGPDGRLGTICHDCETRRRTPATQHAAHDTPLNASQTPSSSE